MSSSTSIRHGPPRNDDPERGEADVKPDDDVNDDIDAAYGANDDRYSARYVDPMIGPEARAATIRLVPR